MKFENIYRLCKKHYNNTAELDMRSFHHIMNELNQIECFKESIKNVDYIFKNPGKCSDGVFSEAKKILFSKMETIIDLYESMNLQTGRLPSLDIKIPDCDNFTDFKKIINEIEFIVTKCPFTQHEAEFLRFKGVDVGSQWISFAVLGIAAVATGSILLNNIAALVDKCIIIRSHYLTTKQQELEVQKSQREQNEKDELIKNINRLYKIYIENAIKELEEETGCKISDGDERGRAEQSIQKLGELIDKGLQIYSSIDSPKETKALFEPLEMKYLSIEQELKAIEDKKNREREKEESDE